MNGDTTAGRPSLDLNGRFGVRVILVATARAMKAADRTRGGFTLALTSLGFLVWVRNTWTGRNTTATAA